MPSLVSSSNPSTTTGVAALDDSEGTADFLTDDERAARYNALSTEEKLMVS